MLDGIQHNGLIKVMATCKGKEAVEFFALNKTEARQMLKANGMEDYKIAWVATPYTNTKK